MSYPDEIQAYLERSGASLQAAKILLESSLFDDAASRAYYAAFYAVSALLISQQLTFNSHSGVLRAFSLQFVKTQRIDRHYGRDLSWLAELRQVGDYGDLKHVSLEEATKAIQVAKSFLEKARLLLES
ncbi:MAG: HEPN domain-containing protein [Leptolyngbya sp. SIO4C5]|nr:HEPN domain-containing protein [Leptolyngbya sp. SIO4C5]